MRAKQQRGLTMVLGGLGTALGLVFVDRGILLAWRPGGLVAIGLSIALPSLFVAYDAFREK